MHVLMKATSLSLTLAVAGCGSAEPEAEATVAATTSEETASEETSSDETETDEETESSSETSGETGGVSVDLLFESSDALRHNGAAQLDGPTGSAVWVGGSRFGGSEETVVNEFNLPELQEGRTLGPDSLLPMTPGWTAWLGAVRAREGYMAVCGGSVPDGEGLPSQSLVGRFDAELDDWGWVWHQDADLLVHRECTGALPLADGTVVASISGDVTSNAVDELVVLSTTGEIASAHEIPRVPGLISTVLELDADEDGYHAMGARTRMLGLVSDALYGEAETVEALAAALVIVEPPAGHASALLERRHVLPSGQVVYVGRVALEEQNANAFGWTAALWHPEEQAWELLDGVGQWFDSRVRGQGLLWGGYSAPGWVAQIGSWSPQGGAEVLWESDLHEVGTVTILPRFEGRDFVCGTYEGISNFGFEAMNWCGEVQGL